MSDAAWRGLGALGVLFFGYLLWAFEPVLWQQALLALLALDSCCWHCSAGATSTGSWGCSAAGREIDLGTSL